MNKNNSGSSFEFDENDEQETERLLGRATNNDPRNEAILKKFVEIAKGKSFNVPTPPVVKGVEEGAEQSLRDVTYATIIQNMIYTKFTKDSKGSSECSVSVKRHLDGEKIIVAKTKKQKKSGTQGAVA